MPSQKKLTVQSAFLDRLRGSHQNVTVFLTNGVKLQGRLTWADDEVITLTRDGVTQLVYKHAVSTVMPEEAFQVHELLDDEAGNI